jgi:hypothetical protein
MMRRRLNGIGGREIGQAVFQSWRRRGHERRPARLAALDASPAAIITTLGALSAAARPFLLVLLSQTRELALLRRSPAACWVASGINFPHPTFLTQYQTAFNGPCEYRRLKAAEIFDQARFIIQQAALAFQRADAVHILRTSSVPLYTPCASRMA